MKAMLASWLSLGLIGSALAQVPAGLPTNASAPLPATGPATGPIATTSTATFAQRYLAGDYAGALPLAEADLKARAVASPGSPDHLTALLNLASTQYQLGNYAGAVDTFGAAAKLSAEQFGDNSPRTVSPLRGLGMALLAQQRPAEAAPILARAVALSRRTQGLFNDEQAAIAIPLVAAYQQLGMYTEAEREQQYAYRGAEVHFGTNDLRLLPALDRLGRWYEETSRPAQARMLHRRAFTIATEPKKTSASGAVRALIGVARTYFVEYRDGPEVQESMDAGTASFRFSTDNAATPQPGNTYYLDPQAERALQLAIEIAERAQHAGLQEEAITSYGEYLLLDGKAAAAEKQFSRVALLRTARIAAGLVSALEPDPLATPKPLLVRKPVFARRNEQSLNEDVDTHTTVVTVTVTPQGTVTQPKIVSSDISNTHQRQWTSALERAVYRPRYVDGKAVTTEGMEVVLVSRTLKADRPAAKPEAKADAKAEAKAAEGTETPPEPAKEASSSDPTPTPP